MERRVNNTRTHSIARLYVPLAYARECVYTPTTKRERERDRVGRPCARTHTDTHANAIASRVATTRCTSVTNAGAHTYTQSGAGIHTQPYTHARGHVRPDYVNHEAGIMRSNDLQITGFAFRLAQKRDLTPRGGMNARARAREADSRRSCGELMDNMCPRAGTRARAIRAGCRNASERARAPARSFSVSAKRNGARTKSLPARDFGLLNTFPVGADFT